MYDERYILGIDVILYSFMRGEVLTSFTLKEQMFITVKGTQLTLSRPKTNFRPTPLQWYTSNQT